MNSDFLFEDKVLIKYTGSDNEVVIPQGTEAIDNRAFYHCHSLHSITIPDSVRTIGFQAFSDCPSLASIVIPAQVKVIKALCFADCSSLETVILPEGLCEIKHSAFKHCNRLKNIIIPDTVTVIGDSAFEGCESLSSFTIPDGVKNIPLHLFEDCTSLESVKIGEGAETVSCYVFFNCSSLKRVTMGDSVKQIGSLCFSGCNALTELKMGKSVKLRNSNFSMYKTVPPLFSDHFMEIMDHVSDAELIKFFSECGLWSCLSIKDKVEIFIARQGKKLIPVYRQLICNPSLFGMQLLDVLKQNTAGNVCKAAANFMDLFVNELDENLPRQFYATMVSCKSGSKACKQVMDNPLLKEKLGEGELPQANESNPKKQVLYLLSKDKKTVKDLNETFIAFYGKTVLPVIKDKNGNELPSTVLKWLLTVHEELNTGKYDTGMVIAYLSPGICEDAEKLLASIDHDSFQHALEVLANNYLGYQGQSKKHNLAYEICRYADLELMEKLIKRAPGWASKASGKEAPALRSFRKACIYSTYRCAGLFADSYGDLYSYASLRNQTEEEIRDHFLSDIGLDREGKKIYDLGKETVTVTLLPDFSFSLQTKEGKLFKSVPKRGSDPEKYEIAKKDFDEIKKLTGKIVKTRNSLLFDQFLNGTEQSAKSWVSCYCSNPVLANVASKIVWAQENETFILKDHQLMKTDGSLYELTDRNIRVAHPMEMDHGTLAAWQYYFYHNALKQPFNQLWEPVIKPEKINKDYYKGIKIPLFRFTNKEKHGITVYDSGVYQEPIIDFDGCRCDIRKSEDWYLSSEYEMPFEIDSFEFEQFDRKVNHIVGYLNRVTMIDRIIKNDLSISDQLSSFTLVQIMDFIRIATENHCTAVNALLLQYKETHFPDYDLMDEFVLEDLEL